MPINSVVLILGIALQIATATKDVNATVPFASDVLNFLNACTSTDLYACLKIKFVVALERIARNLPKVQLAPDIAFVKDPDAPQTLRRSMHIADAGFWSLVGHNFKEFLNAHLLQVRF